MFLFSQENERINIKDWVAHSASVAPPSVRGVSFLNGQVPTVRFSMEPGGKASRLPPREQARLIRRNISVMEEAEVRRPVTRKRSYTTGPLDQGGLRIKSQ